MNVVLISTYELGRQPFGLASPAAWLTREGCAVTCVDLSVQPLAEREVEAAELIAFYVPMHTATRLAARSVDRVRKLNAAAHLCFFGLYAPLNESFLKRLGAGTVLGGEFESGLVSLVRRLRAGPGAVAAGEQPEPRVSLERQEFLTPERAGLPALEHYARLQLAPDRWRTVGSTEASRGCRHRCRHCPIVPVYEGRFRVVQREVVLRDIRNQVARGAEHITFGDPDFLNGPTHALAVVEGLHEEFPDLSYDVTIKIEHLLRHRERLPALRDSGCLFVTTAVESVDDRVLERLDKGHTRADFYRAVHAVRAAGLRMNPTFVTFTPWTTPQGFVELLQSLLELDLVDEVATVQYAIRLLVTRGSRLLELPEVRNLVGPFDEERLVYPWVHPDPAADRLHGDLLQAIAEGQRRHESRRRTFRRVWELAHRACDGSIAQDRRVAALDLAPPRATVPFLTEPWYC